MGNFYYEFSIDEEQGLVKISNFSDAILLSIPRERREEKYYSYVLHYADIRYAIMYLEKALQVEEFIEKEALFEAAIMRYMKCFTSTKSGRKQLAPEKVYSELLSDSSIDPLGCHKKFKEIRNLYIAHDQNDFLNIRMGIVLQNDELKGVVCPPRQTMFLYEENISILLTLCKVIYNFVSAEMDEEIAKIHQRYEKEWDIKEIKLLPKMKI